MCQFIDENVSKIVTPGEDPELENLIYNYLWLIVKALAIKKRMFTNFEDYDGYAFYSATRLFFALRKNQLNQGLVIKGKLIRPIKSCLNYTKALLYPMKIEYQRETFKEIIEEEFVSKKFDAFTYKEQLKNSAKASAGVPIQFQTYVKETLQNSGHLLDELLQKSPFNNDTLEYGNIKKSVLLNSIYILKARKKLEVPSQQNIILWHLPKTMTSYVKVLIGEFFMKLKLEIIDSYKASDLDEETVAAILNTNLEGDYFEE